MTRDMRPGVVALPGPSALDNLRFAIEHDIRSYNEAFPLSEAPRAYQRMIGGDARFRVILNPGK